MSNSNLFSFSVHQCEILKSAIEFSCLEWSIYPYNRLTNSQVAPIIKQSNETAATAVSFETQFTTLSCKPRTNHLYWHFITTVCYLSRCQESCSFYSRIKINADSQKLHSRPFSANKIKSKLIKCSHAKIILIVQLRGIQLPFDFFFLFWFNIIVIFKLAFRENDSISCRRLFPYLGN